MTLAQSHVETFENTVLHKVAVTTNPREGTKILRILSILRIVAVTTNPREGTGKSALNELEMSSG